MGSTLLRPSYDIHAGNIQTMTQNTLTSKLVNTINRQTDAGNKHGEAGYNCIDHICEQHVDYICTPTESV